MLKFSNTYIKLFMNIIIIIIVVIIISVFLINTSETKRIKEESQKERESYSKNHKIRYGSWEDMINEDYLNSLNNLKPKYSKLFSGDEFSIEKVNKFQLKEEYINRFILGGYYKNLIIDEENTYFVRKYEIIDNNSILISGKHIYSNSIYAFSISDLMNIFDNIKINVNSIDANIIIDPNNNYEIRTYLNKNKEDLLLIKLEDISEIIFKENFLFNKLELINIIKNDTTSSNMKKILTQEVQESTSYNQLYKINIHRIYHNLYPNYKTANLDQIAETKKKQESKQKAKLLGLSTNSSWDDIIYSEDHDIFRIMKLKELLLPEYSSWEIIINKKFDNDKLEIINELNNIVDKYNNILPTIYKLTNNASYDNIFELSKKIEMRLYESGRSHHGIAIPNTILLYKGLKKYNI